MVVRWSVVIPVKRLSLAKSRLRGARTQVAHDDLVLALAADTVAAALDSPAVHAAVVVTDEPVVREAVSRLGAVPVPDVPDRGLNPAVEYGAAYARRRHPDAGVAAVGADLAALRADELTDALAAAAAHPRAYVRDEERTGTVLLTARPGSPLAPRFGPDSARRHRDDGAVELTGHWPSLRRDIDTPDDLTAAAELGLGRHTTALLTAHHRR